MFVPHGSASLISKSRTWLGVVCRFQRKTSRITMINGRRMRILHVVPTYRAFSCRTGVLDAYRSLLHDGSIEPNETQEQVAQALQLLQERSEVYEPQLLKY